MLQKYKLIFKYNRSQAAMEFLMTYGWALMVVLLVIGGLSYFGVLDVNKFLPEKVELSPELNVIGMSAHDGYVKILVENIGDKKFIDLNFTLANCNTTGIASDSKDLIVGDSAVFVIPCDGRIKENSRYISDINFSYKTKTAGVVLEHKDSGFIHKNVDFSENIVAGDSAIPPGYVGLGSCIEVSLAIENDLDGKFALTDDITCGDIQDFEPIENFEGVFDGNGKTISNLNIDGSGTSYVGLFKTLDSGVTVKNVKLSNIEVHGGQYTGAIAGRINSGAIVQNVEATGMYINCTSSYCGGITGRNDGQMNNSRFGGTINCTGTCGGVTGYNSGTIYDNDASASVFCSSSTCGGVVGNNRGTVNRTSFNGDVTSLSGTMGGFFGDMGSPGLITESYSNANVNCTECGTSWVWSGAFGGRMWSGAKVEKSYADGYYNSTGVWNSGFVGELFSGAIVTDVYSKADVYRTTGFAGKVNTGTTVERVLVIGEVEHGSFAISPQAWGNTINNTFFDTESTTTSSGCGGGGCSDTKVFGKTTAEIQTDTTFLDKGWDPSIWYFQNGQYPRLQWELE